MKKNIIINLIEKSLDFENDKNFELFLIKKSIHFYDYLCDYFLLNDLTNIFIEYNLILDNQIKC